MTESETIGRRRQLQALVRAVKYKPAYFATIVVGGVFAAVLEGVGLSFIVPIVELVQTSGDPSQQADGIFLVFVSGYEYLQVPFTLGSVIAGVSVVLTVRWISTFIVRWLREVFVIKYTAELQRRSFELSLDAKTEYFDREGSDDILNAIVTQSEYAGRVVSHAIQFLEQLLLSIVYLLIAFLLAPVLTVAAIVILGGFSLLVRYVVESGYELGDKVAEANERIQQTAQAGTQGIRDTKLFGIQSELLDEFLSALDLYVRSSTTIRRNKLAIKNFYNLLTALSVFLLIYVAITFANMSIGALGVFLFAMFRLGPKASNLNSIFYRIENTLPHLVRTQQFNDELSRNHERSAGTKPVPAEIHTVEFDDVSFSYEGTTQRALKDVSFSFEKDEFVGLVGKSGAGKSTVMSILTRMYEADTGSVLVNECSIYDMDIDEYRSHVAVVRQNPFIFNDTLRYNLTIGNRGATDEEIEKISRISRVSEFVEDLPNGYDTELGDEGVRLSGGQRQRVALARALLKDADVLVLDEATSDLDSHLEKQVQTAIEEMERDYAIVAIAHRLSTLQNADRIYTMEDGQFVEIGTHQELLENGGTYADLYTIQSE